MRLDRGRPEIRILFEFESFLIDFSIRFQQSDLLVATIRFEISVRIRIYLWIWSKIGRI